jgi:hypothetical protein
VIDFSASFKSQRRTAQSRRHPFSLKHSAVLYRCALAPCVARTRVTFFLTAIRAIVGNHLTGNQIAHRDTAEDGVPVPSGCDHMYRLARRGRCQFHVTV